MTIPQQSSHFQSQVVQGFSAAIFPRELTELKQWVNWKLQARADGGKPTKVPYHPNGKTASTTQASTWSNYETVTQASAGFTGIGFVFNNNGITGIDIDHCIDENGNLSAKAELIIKHLNSYTEISPSGTGLHVFIKAKKPAKSPSSKNGVEVYDKGRYFTMTGQRWPGMPETIEERQAQLDWLIRNFLEPDKKDYSGDSGLDWELVREALGYIPSDDYNDWILTGMALYSTDHPQAFDEWDNWSKKSAKYSPGETQKRWRTFKASGRGIGSLFKDAQSYGWQHPGAQAAKSEKQPATPATPATLLPFAKKTSIKARKNGLGGAGFFNSEDLLPVATLATHDWPEPEPLYRKLTEPEPYPVQALPDGIRQAIEEAYNYYQAPLPLVASSALSALSLAGQGVADVARDSRLKSPTSLFFLTLGESGERKTAVDGAFTAGAKAWQKQRQEAVAEVQPILEAEIKAWTTEVEEAEARLKKLAKDKKDLTAAKEELAEILRQQPIMPLVPGLFFNDTTPEALERDLMKRWPSAGLFASEGGTFFGGHGMNTETITRNLSLYNILWDGGEKETSRIGRENVIVRDVRLSLSVMVQPSALADFYKKNGNLSRGIGFFARFLLAWPETTQGTRFYREPQDEWQSIGAFNKKIFDLLDATQLIQKDEKSKKLTLSPTLWRLESGAKALWVYFHDQTEKKLAKFGEFADVRDLAAKAADNVARLSALFALYGQEGGIRKHHVEQASEVVNWHLRESLRFFGEIIAEGDATNTKQLDDFLKRTGEPKAKKWLLQHAPSGLRKAETLDNALEELEELGRVEFFKDGKKTIIAYNPLCNERPKVAEVATGSSKKAETETLPKAQPVETSDTSGSKVAKVARGNAENPPSENGDDDEDGEIIL